MLIIVKNATKNLTEYPFYSSSKFHIDWNRYKNVIWVWNDEWIGSFSDRWLYQNSAICYSQITFWTYKHKLLIIREIVQSSESAIIWHQNQDRENAEQKQFNRFTFSRFTSVIYKPKSWLSYFVNEILSEQL